MQSLAVVVCGYIGGCRIFLQVYIDAATSVDKRLNSTVLKCWFCKLEILIRLYLCEQKKLMKKENENKKNKLKLKSASRPNVFFEIRSLDKFREVGNYTWIAEEITEEMGFPDS